MNDCVKDLDPPDKIVTEAHFSQGSDEERPVDPIESLVLIKRKADDWQIVTHCSDRLHHQERQRSQRYSGPAHHRSWPASKLSICRIS